MMSEEMRAAQTISKLIGQTWLAAGSDKGNILANHLEFVLQRYEDNKFSSVPPSTLWLAHEVISQTRNLPSYL